MTALLTLVLGRDDNNSSLKWFTYGERLKRGTSVRDWHDTNSATAIEWPAQLVSYFANKPDQSPVPKRPCIWCHARDTEEIQKGSWASVFATSPLQCALRSIGGMHADAGVSRALSNYSNAPT